MLKKSLWLSFCTGFALHFTTVNKQVAINGRYKISTDINLHFGDEKGHIQINFLNLYLLVIIFI